MKQGFVKVAAVTPKIKVADTAYNGKLICSYMEECAKEGAKNRSISGTLHYRLYLPGFVFTG